MRANVKGRTNARIYLTYHQILERRNSLYKYSFGYNVHADQMFYPSVAVRIHEVKDIHRTKVEEYPAFPKRKLNVKTKEIYQLSTGSTLTTITFFIRK